jgi:PAS domain S-box-containing protein
VNDEKNQQDVSLLLQTALNQSPSGILIADAPDVKIRWANNAALGIRGDSDEKLTDIEVEEHARRWQTYHSDGVTPYNPEELPLSRAILKGETITGEVLIIRNDAGENRIVSANAAPIRNDKNEIISGVVVFHDITELKESQIKYRSLLIEKERLNRNICRYNDDLKSLLYLGSHDLKAPLVNIEGFTKEFIYELEDLFTDLEQENIPQSAVDKINGFRNKELSDFETFVHSGVMELYSLINGMSQIAKVGNAALKPELIDMNELMMDLEVKLNMSIREAGAKILTKSLPKCVADPTLMSIIFTNLVSNAIKYRSPDRPCRVKISGEVKNDYITYCISDNGIGISEAEQKNIFHAFYRAKKLPSLGSKGHGLGLSLAKWACTKIEGEVWVESVKGEGSTFFVVVPTVKKS